MAALRPVTTLPWRSPRQRRWRFFQGLTIVCAVLFVVDGLWLRGWYDATSWLVGYAVVGGIVALATWSIGRYGDLVVTATQLRVGRATLAATELDPEWLERLGSGDRPVLERKPAILGGGFDTPAGWQVLPIRLLDGAIVGIATADPDGLLSALLLQQRS